MQSQGPSRYPFGFRARRRSDERQDGFKARSPQTRRLGRIAILSLGGSLLAVGVASAVLYSFPTIQLAHRYTVMAAALIPYGLLALAPAAVIFAVSSRRWTRTLAVLAVGGLVLHAWWARPYWPSNSPTTGSVTVLTMNLRCDSRGTSDLAELVERVRPDVAVVQGFYPSRAERLGDAWNRLLPHASFHPMSHLPACGTAVYSRTPLTELPTPSRQPAIEVSGTTPFVLLPVDMPTPSHGVAPWLDGFQDLTEAAIAHNDEPLVVVGDFNAVREHFPMRALLTDADLRDAAELSGRGWAPTFPAASWHPPVLGLDHVLVSPGLIASDFRTHRIGLQQHRAISVKIGLPSDQER